MKLILLSTIFGLAFSEVYFKDDFSDGDAWTSRWVESTHKEDYGVFELSHGSIYSDEEADKGLRTSEDAHFYARSAKFDSFSNAGKDMVVQFSVKHEQKIDCGGGYVKLFPSDFNSKDMHGESKYYVMFGPDICGYSTKKVHVIINYNDKNHLIEKEIKCKDDEFTHVYTLHIKPSNEYEVYIDGESAQSGSMEEDWDMLPAKTIKDPEQSKPADWVDVEEIDDPEDTKPAGWDEESEYIADPDAEKPEDWDEEMDGEWEAPMINNADFKGEWSPKKVENPEYKGAWEHPEIDNPAYKSDSTIYEFADFGAIGLDLWQVKSGTVFDNFLISDDIEGAVADAKAIVEARHAGEKSKKEEMDAAKKAEEGDAEGDDGGMDDGGDEEEIDDYEDEFDEDDFDDDYDEMDGHDEL